jgi:enterochelin esterase-like enzyme
VLHGYPFDETHWEQLGMIERVDAGIRDLGWRPFLIIMPGAPDVLYINSDGGPGSYEAEFLGGLLPFVETHYAVVTSGSERAIAGISRGGVWALEIGFRHPELFNTVAALSPALQVNYARPDYDPYILVSRSESLPANILLSAGDAEWSFSQATERLAEMLSERGAPYVYVHASGGHDAANWEGVIGDMLLFLTEAWHLQE